MSLVTEITGLMLAIAGLLGGQLIWRRYRTIENARSAAPTTMRPGTVLLVDTTVVLALWLVVLPVSVSMRSRLTPEQWLYFWSQISGRWMGIIRPLLFMAAGFLMIELARRLTHRRPLLAPMVVALAMALSVPAVRAWANAGSHADIVNRLEADFANVDRTVQAGGAVALGDAGIYYAVSKALDTRRDPSPVSAGK